MTAIGIDLLRRSDGRAQGAVGVMGVLPSGTAQPDLPLAEVYGPTVILTNRREVPLSEGSILHATRAPDVSPADPCNKMAFGAYISGSRFGSAGATGALLRHENARQLSRPAKPPQNGTSLRGRRVRPDRQSVFIGKLNTFAACCLLRAQAG